MRLNIVTRLREDLLSDYHYIKRHSEFEEYSVPYLYHPSYSCNARTYISLLQSLLVSLTNGIYVKSSTSSQAYKVVNNHAHEISGLRILSRIFLVRAPHLGGMSGDVQFHIVTLEFNNVEQL